jgi:hypothetical protein
VSAEPTIAQRLCAAGYHRQVFVVTVTWIVTLVCSECGRDL